MRILVFTTLFPNNIQRNNGVFVKERMCEVARLENCEVKVVAPVPYYPPIQVGWRAVYSQVVREEIIDGVHVYHPRYFMIPKVAMVLHGLLMFLNVYFVVKKIRKEFDFDIIDAHYVYPDGFVAVLLGRCFRRPVVVSARGSDINQFSQFPVIRKLLQFTLRKSVKVISVCVALKDAMIDLEIPAEKITVVPNGVDVQKFHLSNKETARKKLGMPEDGNIIISVGGLIPRKGFDLLIRAVKILIGKLGVGNLRLVVVGEGPCRTELEKLISLLNLKDNVHLTGAVPHQDLHLWYSAADLSCLTSSREGWPNVLLESLACGTPVVATATWGVPEIITSEQIGLLTERTEDAIAEKILLALTKQWKTETLVEYAKEHTWGRTAVGVLQVFRELVNENIGVSDALARSSVIKRETAKGDGVNT